MTEKAYQEQLRSLFSALLLTRVDEFNVDYRDYYLDPSYEFAFAKAVGEEPLQLMSYIAVQDTPWTDILTADHTMANQLLLDLWPLEAIGDQPRDNQWVPAKYTDGRPSGGIIMSNGLWWRHYTTPNNKSRSRASFLTKLLICDDHLAREVNFEPQGLGEEEDLENLVATDPSCIACHNTLDPVAASLYGFWQHDIHDVIELDHYHPERERIGEQQLNTPMAWYGVPLDAPADLGPTIANDTRFLSCTVSQMSELLWKRPIDPLDQGRLQQLTQAFENGERRLAALILAILQSPEYQIGNANGENEPRFFNSRRLLNAHQIASAIGKITGFYWIEEGFELLENDNIGFRVLAGGIDGRTVTKWQKNPSASRQLTLKRFTQLAAENMVNQSWEQSNELVGDHQLANIDNENPIFEEILTDLHRQIYAETPSEERIQIDKEMWFSIAEQSSPKQAWISLISVLFRDSEAWIY
jgi:hypothetical protein